GQEIPDRPREQAAEVPGAGGQPVPPLRAQPRLHAQVRHLPNLLPGAGVVRSPARSHQVELV
ncbi:MAG: SSU ribosomal protein S14p (S29e) @ SSU ribosomal protein S14p (S29e), zinc-dependent, partial [uncultured Thermomicrobiales bacterium]